MTTNTDTINNAFGAIISLKVVETGFKMIDKQTNKTKRGRHRGFL